MCVERKAADPEQLREAESLLDRDEEAQYGNSASERNRRRYVLTRALVRCVLSRYSDRRPEEWRFAHDRQGRPRIADPSDEVADVSFSIAHSDGLIVCAVTKFGPIGVDVERIREKPSAMDIAKRTLVDVEIAGLLAVSGTRRMKRFFRLWTLKESFAKAKSVGISLPFRFLRFGFSPRDGIVVEMDARLEERWQDWWFASFGISTTHVVGLSLYHRLARRPLLSVFEFQPARSMKSCKPAALRRSR